MENNKSLLDQLNPMQREAVEQTEGPVLILAGAGSGKTRALTFRVAYLIHEKKVPPKNVLAMTFTNKAAQEMAERVKALLGLPKTIPPYSQYLPHIGTFHSTCVRILRREIEKIGYKKSFVIYDDQDQLALMKRVMKELSVSQEQMKPTAILHAISDAKNKLIDAKMFEDQVGSYFEEVTAKCFSHYQHELKSADALDFDDIILLTVQLFRKYPEVLNAYQELFRYIMVDEYQDTNHAQYMLLKLLAQKHKNICVVGDDWQCCPAGTKILTANGLRNIEQLKMNDIVLAAAGRGDISPQKITKTKKYDFQGTLIKIITKSGKKLTCTPNHILFSRLSLNATVYYVYLMYSKEKGYRIGQAKGVRHANGRQEKSIGLNVRANQERADRMWVLKVVCSKAEAQYWEWYLSLSYQIPTVVFHAYQGREMKVTQPMIDLLYQQIDTRKNAHLLFQDFHLLFDYPHHLPQATIRNQTVRMNLRCTLFSDKRKTLQSPWCAHRISINSSNFALKQTLEKRGYVTRKGKRKDWRLEISNITLSKLETLLQQMKRDFPELEIVRTASITKGKTFFFQPAGHIRNSMILGVWDGKTIVDDEVASVESIKYHGPVYDLDIENVHNYIAQGVVVHNSIYGWRGADVQNILDFEKDYPNAKVVKLEQNYRSTQNILDAAYSVISKNINRKDKKLWTENTEGHLLISYEARDEKDEAQFVVEEIQRLKKEMNLRLDDFSILYRTNAQSRALEEAFMKAALPYKIIGGVKFYQRKEIKDILGYLHFITNPLDKVSFDRIVNVPARGIGDKTVGKIIAFADQRNIDLLHALQQISLPDVAHAYGIAPAKAKAMGDFSQLIQRMQGLAASSTTSMLIEKIYSASGYQSMLLKEGEEGLIRDENVKELLTVAKKYDPLGPDGLASFLEEVALVSQTDVDLGTKDMVPLMTLHSAKGLEFEVIFIVGMEEGLLPHSRAILSEKEMEEERRLCYVGITRAKQKAYLLFTMARNIYGTTQTSIRSRFMDEINPALLEEQFSEKDDFGFYPDSEYPDDFDDVNALAGRPITGKPGGKGKRGVSKQDRALRDGDMVIHPEFGRGIVIAQDENLITVAFPKLGLKKLAKGIAPLKKA